MADEVKFNLKWNDFSSKLIESFSLLHQTESFHDVTLCLQDGMVKAHKAILSICSPFLHDIFKDGQNEVNQMVHVTDVSTKNLQSLLTFVYSGEVFVDQESIPGFMELAGFLRISGIVEGSNMLPADPVPASRQQKVDKAKKPTRRHTLKSKQHLVKPPESKLDLPVVEVKSLAAVVEDQPPFANTMKQRLLLPNPPRGRYRKRNTDEVYIPGRKETIGLRVQCSECGINIDKRSYVRHLRVIHKKGPPPITRVREGKAKKGSKETKTQPLKEGTDPRNLCTIECMHCGKRISRKSFKRHLLVKHGDEIATRTKCPRCNRRYRHKEYLEEHCRIKHGLVGEPYRQELEAQEAEGGVGFELEMSGGNDSRSGSPQFYSFIDMRSVMLNEIRVDLDQESPSLALGLKCENLDLGMGVGSGQPSAEFEFNSAVSETSEL